LKSYKILDKKSVVIDKSVKIGKNVVIHSNNVIKGNTVIEDNVILKENNYICDSIIGDGSIIEYSHISGAKVGREALIGPFSRIRPNTIIGDKCKIGNFVEIKNSTIGSSTKASHLAYIGDSNIGENCNIGCGVIFVNYNGKEKKRSIVGDNCFIGSNVNVIAPVKIANDSYVCAGTTITIDTNPFDFVIGRVRETVKPNYSKKYKKDWYYIVIYKFI